MTENNQIDLYLDDLMDEDERSKFEALLSTDADLKREVEALLSLKAMIREHYEPAQNVDLPSDFMTQLDQRLDQYDQERRSEGSGIKSLLKPFWKPVFGLVVLTLILGLLLVRTDGQNANDTISAPDQTAEKQLETPTLKKVSDQNSDRKTGEAWQIDSDVKKKDTPTGTPIDAPF